MSVISRNGKTHMKSTTMILATILSQVSMANTNELISDSPENAKVYFISPVNDQTVKNPFKVHFGLANMGIAPAGINIKNTGHHHILIDTDLKTIDLDKPIPATSKIIHFGGGQTETELSLSPGKHTLQLLLGNFVHIPHNKAVASEKITITVE